MKTGIIIQARMGSTRLPGKVLMPMPKVQTFGGRATALDWTIKACCKTGFDVYVATSTNSEDDAIEDHVNSHYVSVDIFRGSPEDVLDRLYQCAGQFELDVIVRVTGDCPFVDPEVIKQVVRLRDLTDADYASNVDPPMWPDGLDVQCVTFKALERAHKLATAPTDRETVLQYMVHHRDDFHVVNMPCPLPGMSAHRWVLDTEMDYATCSQMATQLAAGKGPGASMADVMAVAPEPEDKSGQERNERYLASRAGELKADGFRRSAHKLGWALKRQPYGASTYSKSRVAWGGDAPLFVTHAQGSRVWDVDGNEYIDMTAALGTTILGYCDPSVRDAIEQQLDRGIAFPLAWDGEAKVAAQLIRKIFPNGGLPDHMAVFGKNGSDVTSAAVRLARVVTGRVPITRLTGGYHGWHDWALSGTTRGDGCLLALGVYHLTLPEATSDEAINAAFEGDNILKASAALILEPDMVPPGCLERIIDICHRADTLVIFDEMVTAFRYPGTTVANRYGLHPDLICLGKALGNGMPIAALVGPASLMKRFTHSGPETYAFYSGTHFGETLSLAAASAVLDRMGPFEQGQICGSAAYLSKHVSILHGIASDIAATFKGGCIPKLTFHNPGTAAKFRREMARNGVLFYSTFMPTLMHTRNDLEHVLTAVELSFTAIKDGTARGKPPVETGIMRS